MHTCYYDDLRGEFASGVGLARKCPICKFKIKLRKVRIALNVVICPKVKNLQIEVPSTSCFNMATLRRIKPSMITEVNHEARLGRTKVTFFEGQGQILNMNSRSHPTVSDIQFYERNLETILANKACHKHMELQKSTYRVQRIIEKSIDMYDAAHIARTVNKDDCNFCGCELYPQRRLTDGLECDSFCNSCFGRLKRLHSDLFRKKDQLYNIEKQKRKTDRIKRNQSKNRCPSLIIKPVCSRVLFPDKSKKDIGAENKTIKNSDLDGESPNSRIECWMTWEIWK